MLATSPGLRAVCLLGVGYLCCWSWGLHCDCSAALTCAGVSLTVPVLRAVHTMCTAASEPRFLCACRPDMAWHVHPCCLLQVGPGGDVGGMQFGSAFDGRTLYVNNANSFHNETALEKSVPSRVGEQGPGPATTNGSFVAAVSPVAHQAAANALQLQQLATA
jgi:hypothetical protein